MMARRYYYRILRYTPNNIRGETINIGIVVFKRGLLDIYMLKNGDKIRALTGKRGGLAKIKSVKRTITSIYQLGMPTKDLIQLMKSLTPAVSVSEEGCLIADNEREYRQRVTSIMRALIEPGA